MVDNDLLLTPSYSTDLGESLFPLEYYSHVQETIYSSLTYPRSIEQVVDVKQVLSLFSEFLYMNYGRLYRLDPKANRLLLSIGHSFNPERLILGQYEPGEGITGEAFLQNQILFVKDIDDEPQYLGRNYKAKDLPYARASYLAVPFHGVKESGVLGFHLGRRSMVDIYASASIAFEIAQKIGNGSLPMTFPR